MTQLYKRNGAVFIPVWITIEEIEQLEKENAELKEKMGRAGYRIAELKMQIDKMKNCRNCDKEYTNNPDCKDCKHSRKYDGKQDKWEMCVAMVLAE